MPYKIGVRNFDFRGADFAPTEVRLGWAVLSVLPIQDGREGAKYAL